MSDFKVKSYIEQMTINVVKYLENKTGVCQVKNEIKSPAEKPAVLMWEQKNSLLLPEDLKSFFLTSNGFHLTWSVKMENLTIPVGSMHVNSVGMLLKLDGGVREGTHVQPSLWDLDMDEDLSGGRKPPSFCDSRIFELDPCDGHGKVCLVYNETSQGGSGSESDSGDSDSDFHFPHASEFVTEIWFLDRSLHWHYMCDSFLAYYRLMLMHLGLPQWQFAFSDIGLPPQSKQWFNMFAPIRLEVDEEGTVDHSLHTDHVVKVASSPLDLNKIFKGKSDRKKVQGAQAQPTASSSATAANAKRKPPVSSARSATSLGKQVGPPNSQVAVKSSR
ncbi:tubulin polyglutamylase complex subunit 2 isoform X1 [Aplysia californica]|uniref:Tubulin polyglutamylase complex subunit 2 isoform X1 n=1 Tax=Aplysia californica TaxID=6500 RepID=A0ABM0ZYI0_APLCA|nr:tubulin polyglutamylase complex subunit 2 isoform X1 [Aplysia californica]